MYPKVVHGSAALLVALLALQGLSAPGCRMSLALGPPRQPGLQRSLPHCWRWESCWASLQLLLLGAGSSLTFWPLTSVSGQLWRQCYPFWPWPPLEMV